MSTPERELAEALRKRAESALALSAAWAARGHVFQCDPVPLARDALAFVGLVEAVAEAGTPEQTP